MTREIGLALTIVVAMSGAAGAQEQDILFFSAPIDAAQQAPVMMPLPAPGLGQAPADYRIESGPPFGAGIRIERRIERYPRVVYFRGCVGSNVSV